MAVHKVPQDVEAEDKLLGPFSFKQFVFILITVGTLYVAYLFFLLHPLLVVLPLPFSFFFGIIGLWPRKDQPVEVYLAAIIRFWLKPRKRVWNQEGHLDLVQITVPKREEKTYSDGLSKVEVHSRLKTLASTMDSRGWASKNVTADEMASYSPSQIAQSDRLVMPQVAASTPLSTAANVPESEDIMDEVNNPVASHFDELSQKTTDDARQAAIASMKSAQSSQEPAMPSAQPPQSYVQEHDQSYYAQQAKNQQDDQDEDDSPMYQAYPEAMQQSVVNPVSRNQESEQENSNQQQQIPTTTKDQSTAILNLANNSDLNISTIAHEAEKSLHSDDVIQLH